MKGNKKTICYPGSSFPAQKKRRSSPLIAFLILLLITVCCIWGLQPYYGLGRIMAEDSDIMHYDSAILPVSTATYAPAKAPFEIPLLVNEKNSLPDDYGPRDLISLDAIETNLFEQAKLVRTLQGCLMLRIMPSDEYRHFFGYGSFSYGPLDHRTT